MSTPFLTPEANQTILATHIEALSRATRGTGVVSGNALSADDPASMTVLVASGRIRIAGAPIEVSAGEVTMETAHSTLPRMDIIYRDTSGEAQVATGSPAVVEDPKSLASWKSYTSPIPASSIPDGAIIGAIYVAPAATTITALDIWMFAGGVEDLLTSVGDPGEDNAPASEKAVRDAIDTCAPAAQGVTGGDAHDHYGGDGGQINHIRLSNIGTNSHAAIDSHIANTSNPHAVTAAQAGADITVSTVHAATNKATPADADEIGVIDSAASYVLKKLTWANLKATLLATLHSATSKTTPADADELQILDSAASFGQKRLTWANLKAAGKTYYDTVYATLTHASRHQSGGADSIKLDDLAAPDNNTDLDASTSKHGLMPKFPGGAARLSGDGSWDTPYWEIPITFGDGVSVIEADSYAVEIPIAAKIVEVRIRSYDSSGVLVSGSVTCNLYRHAYNAVPGGAVDSFVLSGASSYSETGLAIAFTAEQWMTIAISGISTCKRIGLMLKFEAT